MPCIHLIPKFSLSFYRPQEHQLRHPRRQECNHKNTFCFFLLETFHTTRDSDRGACHPHGISAIDGCLATAAWPIRDVITAAWPLCHSPTTGPTAALLSPHPTSQQRLDRRNRTPTRSPARTSSPLDAGRGRPCSSSLQRRPPPRDRRIVHGVEFAGGPMAAPSLQYPQRQRCPFPWCCRPPRGVLMSPNPQSSAS